MRRNYSKPSIVEAICQFSFDPGQPWDSTLPGLIYNEVKDRFPKKRQTNVLQLGIQVAPQGSSPNPATPTVTQEAFSPLQLLSEDELTPIQIAPDALTINKLKPYSSWDELKPVILYALEKYQKAASPKALRRIGLRYINRIQIPSPQIKLEDYLLAYPNIPESLPQHLKVWMQRSEIPFGSDGILIIQTGSIKEQAQADVVFLLDLDFVTIGEAFSVDLADSKVGVAHENVEKAFEACITDKTREILGEIV
ncbi:MAG: TIGR04255 family protein [Candidatus Binataceae bacterium]